MQVVDMLITDIFPYLRNPRHNKNAIDKVAASIKEFGFRQPIVVDNDYVIVAGHTRFEAAKQLGLEKVPVHIAEGLTEQQVRAYRLVDNRSAQEATWIDDLLGDELQALLDDNYDLGLTGFDELELNNLLNGPDFFPVTENEQGKLDEKEIKKCPNCGYEL